MLASKDYIRSGLLESGIEMLLEKLDQKECCGAFWFTKVAPAFNNIGGRVKLYWRTRRCEMGKRWKRFPTRRRTQA